MKNLVSLVIAAFAAMFIASCKNDAFESEGGREVVGYIPVDSTHVDFVDKNGTPIVKNFFAIYASLTAEATKFAAADDAWRNSETLDKSVEETENGEVSFKYNLGVNTLHYSVKKVIYGEKLIPMFKPSLSVKARSMRVNEDPRNGRYYAETTTVYEFCYHGKAVMAETTQPFVAEEGYVPSFLRAQVIERDKHNLGTVEAKLANNKINITCLDSLLYKELFDDWSLRNEGSLPFHSFNECSLSISGQEVNDTTVVVGKSWTGGSASLGGFELSTSWLSNKVSEKSLVATMSTGAEVDFIDSVHVCKWVPVGGKVLSTKKIRLDYAREGVPADKIAIEIAVNITQREKPVYLLRVDSSFVHNNYVSTVVVNGTNLPVVSNHTAKLEKIMNNGTKADKTNVPYKWTNNYSVSYNQNMVVDDLNAVLGRHTVNSNGSVTVAGYNFTVSFVNRVCDDIMYNGKNYKAYAPICKAKVVAITINQNSLVVEFQGDHDGDNSVIKATLPLTVTEKEKPYTFNGRLNHMWCTMSLIDGPSGVATIDGVYLQGDVTLKDGRSFAVAKKYGNMTNDGTITVTYNPDEAWDMVELNTEQLNRISNNHPLAWTGKTPKAKWGYIDLNEVHLISNGNYEITYYNLLTGNESRNVCATGATIDSKYPYPVVGTWKDGKITIAGRTLYINGSEN